jgi:hypothetical protein
MCVAVYTHCTGYYTQLLTRCCSYSYGTQCATGSAVLEQHLLMQQQLLQLSQALATWTAFAVVHAA